MREKKRVALLLEINRELLQEGVNLQSQGKAGLPGGAPNQSAQQVKEEEKDNDQKQIKYPKEFIE